MLLAVGVAACGSDGADDREALRDDEIARELELALQGDTAMPTFEDTIVGVEPDPEAVNAPPQPAPRQAPARTAQRTQEPAPRQQPPAPRPQPQEAAPQPRTVTRSVPVGTTFAITLNQTLSTERNSAGDAFTARLSDPIIGADGRVIVPAGATVRGRVTHVAASNRAGETAVIKVAFESVAFNGQSYPLQATVVEASPERRTRTSGRETAAKVGAGAAAGAILGQVFGRDTESTVKGAVIGAAAGTAIAMGTADVDAVLPAGSRMVIRLDAPIQVQQTVAS